MQRLYDTYRLMRIFPGMAHPDDVRRLPGSFATYAIQFDRVERQIEAERENKRWSGG